MYSGQQVFRANEDVTDFVIGKFGDKRLMQTGALLVKRLCQGMSTTIRKLAKFRALEVSMGRFLKNKKVTTDEIISEAAKKTGAAAKDRHVLLIQDTCEFNFPTQRTKKADFGRTTYKDVRGFFLHPNVVLDADTKEVLGLAGAHSWIRGEEPSKHLRHKKPIEDKESFKWIRNIRDGCEYLKDAQRITVVADREADIYELYHTTASQKIDFVIRSKGDRRLANGESLATLSKTLPALGRYSIDLPGRSKTQKGGRCQLEIRSAPVTLRRPDNIAVDAAAETLNLNVVYVDEVFDGTKKNVDPIRWVLLTSHPVSDFASAKRAVEYYRLRWTAEQVFRTMKSKGFKVEESQIESPFALIKLTIIALIASIRVLQLVHARNGESSLSANDVFGNDDVELMGALEKRLEGKTQKQKNPYKKKHSHGLLGSLPDSEDGTDIKKHHPRDQLQCSKGYENSPSSFKDGKWQNIRA